jgi:hypothetical protein
MAHRTHDETRPFDREREERRTRFETFWDDGDAPPDGAARGETLARALGWFSIALGTAELIAPGTIGRFLGTSRPRLLAAYGLREIATGIGILASRDPQPWVMARIAGDALDLATLAPDAGSDNPRRAQAMGAMVTVGLVTAVDVYCASELRRRF